MNESKLKENKVYDFKITYVYNMLDIIPVYCMYTRATVMCKVYSYITFVYYIST